MHVNKYLVLFLSVGTLFCMSLKSQIYEFRPFRPGVALLAGIKSAIASIELQIANLESGAVGVPTLKEELAKAKEELAAAKNKLGISFLELQEAALARQFDGFSLRFFKTAQVDGVFLYNSLSEKISQIFNNPEIQRRLEGIIRLQHEIALKKESDPDSPEIKADLEKIDRLEQEMKERAEAAVKEIRELGKQIQIMTLDDQRGSNTIKSQINMIRQQLKARLASADVHAQLDPIEQKIAAINQQIRDLLALRFSDDRLILLDQYRNKIRQYQLLLEYLADPSIIQEATTSKILGAREVN